MLVYSCILNGIGVFYMDSEKASAKPFKRVIKRDGVLYLMALPAIVLIFVFCYMPMYGVVIAFQNYVPAKGILGSSWVGVRHFITFFKDPFWWRILRNTIVLGLYTLLFSFPAPIMLALMLNELNKGKFKSVCQTISYMPHFISTVIVIGLMKELFSLSGIVNAIITDLGGTAIAFMERPEWFRTMYVGSGIWQSIGYSSILYLAAISGINQELYESAVIDGAGRWRQIISITIPCIAPTIQIMFIFAIGGLLGNDFQKILLMYDPINYETSDVISTYIYRKGLLSGQYSFSSAVNLLLSAMSFLLLWGTNMLNRKVGAESFF